MRAHLNRALQDCTSVEAIKAAGCQFEALHGPSAWGCICKGQETFSDLYNDHLSREIENAETRQADEEREENIMTLIDSTTTAKEWWDLKWFIDRKPKLLDNFLVTDALEERRITHDIPEEE